MGFVLEFHFSENDYFSNSVLTKEYELRCAPDTDDPFSFEGPEIHKCKGCTIDWKKGKNVTLKTVKKKQKHKSRGLVRTITKTVQNDSFFNFFAPPTSKFLFYYYLISVSCYKYFSFINVSAANWCIFEQNYVGI